MVDRVQLSEITSMRSSVAATRSLSPGQIVRLLDEVEVLLRQRDELVEVLTELSGGPWLEVRRLLGELHRTLDQ